MTTIGWIGTGNMASAIIRGITQKTQDYTMAAYSPNLAGKTDFPAQKLISAAEVAKTSDILFLAVKPYKMAEVLEEIKNVLKPETLVVSIAVSLTLDWYAQRLGQDVPIVRTLPNTCAAVGEGFTALTFNAKVTEAQKQQVISLFAMTGKTAVIEEAQMNAVSALTGSTPALIYMVIEAMADAAVKHGIPRAQAYAMAAQAVKGAGAMVSETGLQPGGLKDQVCSPSGSTIVGVDKAEALGLRSAMLEAVDAIIAKTNQISG